MVKNIILVFGLFTLITANSLCAQQSASMFDGKVPVIAGAVKNGSSLGAENQRIAVYETDIPLSGVIDYYRSFFIANNFMILGGDDPYGYNASVKKEELMFTIRIFALGERTIIQFIW